jgi:hypothetical protein
MASPFRLKAEATWGNGKPLPPEGGSHVSGWPEAETRYGTMA